MIDTKLPRVVEGTVEWKGGQFVIKPSGSEAGWRNWQLLEGLYGKRVRITVEILDKEDHQSTQK